VTISERAAGRGFVLGERRTRFLAILTADVGFEVLWRLRHGTNAVCLRPLRAAMLASAPTTSRHREELTHFDGRIRRVEMRVAVEQLADLLQRLALQNRVPADLVGAGRNGVTLCDLGVFADEAAETVSP